MQGLCEPVSWSSHFIVSLVSGTVLKSFKFMPGTDILAVLIANSLFPSIRTLSHSFRYKYEDADLQLILHIPDF